uniref:mediator of RNA polymerase II transcription subunit 31 isoform X2 n=1 Tax=Halichoerus grypus TaxID=9711 RepID=UPI001659D210|nr:mediator of RNA polymerase II transcription subunit 31 isoform X2 [Halichoerus grypus]
MAAAVAMETDDAGNRLRFQLELEFVQCLANPNYLNFLAQRGYFKDKAFVNYLKYLLYWKEPEYAKYLNCLHLNTRHSHLQLGLLRCPLPGYPCFCSFLPPGSTLPQAKPSKTVFYTEANLIFQKCKL